MTYRKVINTKLVILLMLFGLYTPEYLNRIVIVDIIASGIRLFSYILILLLLVKCSRKLIFEPFNICLIILWAELLLSTILSDIESSLYNYFGTMAFVVCSCFFVEILSIYSPVNGIRCLYWYFSICVLINTATFFIFPDAMYANNRGVRVCWFLGEDNSGYIYYIIASTLAMIYCHYISKKITLLSCLVWASAFITVFSRNIATGIACQIVWTILVLGYQFGWFRKLLKARYVLYAVVGGFVAVVLLRELILGQLVSALGRDITLTGRTLLWDQVLMEIWKSPLLGFGVCTGEEFNMKVHTNLLGAHNWLLMLMFWGGIAAVILFIVMFIFSYRSSNTYRKKPFYRCIVIGMIVIAVRGLAESGHIDIMFMMLTILAYSKEFTQGLENVQTKRRFVIKGIPKIRLLRRDHI